MPEKNFHTYLYITTVINSGRSHLLNGNSEKQNRSTGLENFRRTDTEHFSSGSF